MNRRRTTTITFPAPPAATTKALRATATLLLDIARRIENEHPQRHNVGDSPEPRTDVRPCPRCHLPPATVYPAKTYTTTVGRTQTKQEAYCSGCQRTYTVPRTTT